MLLRCTRGVKNGKPHKYWHLVEDRRLADGRVAQRQVLCLGQINASQREARRKTIDVQVHGARPQVALFPAGSMPADDVDAIGVHLSHLRPQRPRQWGACRLALQLWQQPELDGFWRARLRPPRVGHAVVEGAPDGGGPPAHRPGLGAEVAQAVVRCERDGRSAGLGRRVGREEHAVALPGQAGETQRRVVQASQASLGRVIGARFDVLLLDLTSPCFETDVERSAEDLRRYGCSRDKRGDCPQVVIAPIVSPKGFPPSYEVPSSNAAGCTTLSEFLGRIEQQRYGRANRIRLMGRGIPTEDSLAKMRAKGASCLVDTPKGRLTKLEHSFLGRPWARVRAGVQVKRLAAEDDVELLAQSDARFDNERGMGRRRLRPCVDRLRALQGRALTRAQLLLWLGAARHEAGRAAGLLQVTISAASATT
jgi:hypothetical protein